MSDPKGVINLYKQNGVNLGGGETRLIIHDRETDVVHYFDWGALLVKVSSMRGHSTNIDSLIKELLVYKYVLETISKANPDQLTMEALKTIVLNGESYSNKLSTSFSKALESSNESEDVLL